MTALARGRTSFVPELAEGSAVKLIGLGGVGGIVARYLALFLASLRIRLRLVLIDGDDFEAQNAQRMYFHTEGNKAVVVLEELRRFLKDSSLELSAIEEHVTAENVETLIHEGDLVVLAEAQRPRDQRQVPAMTHLVREGRQKMRATKDPEDPRIVRRIAQVSEEILLDLSHQR